MAVSIFEVFMNAQMNLETFAQMNMAAAKNPLFLLGMEQLKNGIAALESGQGADDTYSEPA